MIHASICSGLVSLYGGVTWKKGWLVRKRVGAAAVPTRQRPGAPTSAICKAGGSTRPNQPAEICTPDWL